MINWKWTEKDDKFLYELCEKLRDKVPFAFSRWGDGEWVALTHNHTSIDKNDEAKRFSAIEYAWEKVNENFSFNKVKNQIESLYGE